MRSKHIIVVSLAAGLSLSSSTVWADSMARLSQASTNVSAASVEIVAGSASAIIEGGQWVVSGIETVGEFVVVTLTSAAEVGTASLRIPSAIAGTASLAVGATVQVVAEATGHALIASGKLIGFIPNEAGKSLLHQSVHSERR